MRVPLRNKITTLAVAAALLPVLVTVAVTLTEERHVSQVISHEIDNMAQETITHVALDLYNLCDTTNTFVEEFVAQAAKGTQKIVAESKGFAMGQPRELVVHNDRTGKPKTIYMSVLKLGDEQIVPTTDANVRVPLVDDVFEITGVPCTIYQRMDNQGDMLRIASSVPTKDGSRGGLLGYIPYKNADGQIHQVLKNILEGKEYVGFNQAQGQNWMVNYLPIQSNNGRILGMIGLGVVIDEIDTLKKTVASTRVGQSGYVWVIEAQGPKAGRYIISPNRARDGENVMDLMDADGKPLVRDIVDQALKSKPGTIIYKHYMWKNPNDPSSRAKFAAYVYFEPWDWIIGVGAYEDDYAHVKNVVRGQLRSLLKAIIGADLPIFFLLTLLAFVMGNLLANPIRFISRVAGKVAMGDLAGAQKALDNYAPAKTGFMGWLRTLNPRDETTELMESIRTMTGNLNGLLNEVRKSGIQVTAGATEIAASARQLEQIVAAEGVSINQASASTKEISMTSAELDREMGALNESTSSTAELAASSQAGLDDIRPTMDSLLHGTERIADKLARISSKADDIGQIVMTITKVANQTNMLSLNAAIEAEKAGEYGQGFAVVAREIRRLADQSAVAALDIEDMVKEMRSVVQDGVSTMADFSGIVDAGSEKMARIGSDLGGIIDRTLDLGPRFETISQSMGSQTQGAEQINQAMIHLMQTTDQTRQSLDEFNRATAQLNDTVQVLHREVSRFSVEDE
ncbi:MAG: methyl-accepting chemotaxis protein [Desulfovibrio sp.]|uniref:methyl-accepting chemotaxis protein n=1 Tax=Desulfovibrio sp. 7SRBS1 TaxID=3378064 RepID=UPI003B405E1B